MWATPKVQDSAGWGVGQEPVTTHNLLGMPPVAHVAAMPLWLVGCSPLFENLEPTTISLPRLLHWLSTFCCTWQRWTFLYALGSQSSHIQAADIDQERHLLRMDSNSKRTMLTFPAAEEVRRSIAPTDSMEEHQCFFIDSFNNLVDSNLSKVESSRSARKCPSARTTNTVRNATLRSHCRATWSRTYLPSYGIMVGDTRRLSCNYVWSRSFHPLCWW